MQPDQHYLLVLLPPIAVLAALFYFFFRNRRNGEARPVPNSKSSLPPWAFVLIAVAGVTSYFLTPSRKGAGRQPLPMNGANWLLVATIAPPVVLLGLLILFVWFKNRDPSWSQASRRAEEGDVDGAIRGFREAMEFRGPTSTRMNNLGTLYSRKDAHEEALKCFLEAETLDRRGAMPLVKDGTLFLLNKAASLRKLGRSEEALPLVEDAVAKHPDQFFSLCIYALVLADLDRFSEAREQMRRADALPKAFVFGKANREANAKFLRDTRDQISALPEKIPLDLDGLA